MFYLCIWPPTPIHLDYLGSRTQTDPSKCRVADEEVGEGKEDVIERVEDRKDRMKYADLGSGRVGARGDKVNCTMNLTQVAVFRRRRRGIDDSPYLAY